MYVYYDKNNKTPKHNNTTALITWCRLMSKNALQSAKWHLIAWANDIAAHYAVIHCPL